MPSWPQLAVLALIATALACLAVELWWDRHQRRRQ